MADPVPHVSALDIARASAELQRVTSRLIQALTAQLREPNEERGREVMALEAERDALHDRLCELEDRYAAQQQRR